MTDSISRRSVLMAGASVAATSMVFPSIAHAQAKKLTVVVSSATAEAGTATRRQFPLRWDFGRKKV